jgi:hypothetical protein
MTTYLVYRQGSNAANQPMTLEACPVYAAEAANQAAAVEAARAAGVSQYANQTLEARPASRCSKTDWQIAVERTDAINLDMASFA